MNQNHTITRLEEVTRQYKLADETCENVIAWFETLKREREEITKSLIEKLRVITVEHLATASVCASSRSKFKSIPDLDIHICGGGLSGFLFTVPDSMLAKIEEAGITKEFMFQQFFRWGTRARGHENIGGTFFELEGTVYLLVGGGAYSSVEFWIRDQGKKFKWHVDSPYYEAPQTEEIFLQTGGARNPANHLLWKLKDQIRNTSVFERTIEPHLENESRGHARHRALELVEKFQQRIGDWTNETTLMTLRTSGEEQTLEIALMRDSVYGTDYLAYCGIPRLKGNYDGYERMIWCAKRGIMVTV